MLTLSTLLLLLLSLSVIQLSTAPYSAYATHFDGIGSPYGGCGLPENALPSLHYVALNVQNTPGDYTTYLRRPITDPSKVGTWDNGYKCGMWVSVTLGDNCVGASNSGEPHTGFCTGGQWVSDEYNGATLTLLVTDSCQDGNEWCRDDTYHLDLHTSSLPDFVKNGEKIGSGVLNGYNNRKISWDWSDPPNYSGDIWIGFRQGAQPIYYVAVAFSNLPNGILGVQRLINGNWVNSTMISDNGQAYQLESSGPPYTVRLATTKGWSKTYTFNYPSECNNACSQPFTRVPYTVS